MKFGRVVLVGRSMGSALSVAEASEYHDVDAVVLTGSLGMDARTLDNDPRAELFFRPALDDPSHRHPAGLIGNAYLSPAPESRVPMFHVESCADPKIIEFDEAIKGTMTRGEMSDIGTASDWAAEIRVPVLVLVLVGEHDALMFDGYVPVAPAIGVEIAGQLHLRGGAGSRAQPQPVPPGARRLPLEPEVARRPGRLIGPLGPGDLSGREGCSDDRHERDALAGLAAEVVGQRQAALYLLGADPAVVGSLAT